MTSFFPDGTPEDPRLALTGYKSTAAGFDASRDAGTATFRLEAANVRFLSRAMSELGPRGLSRLDVRLPAVDHAEDDTEIADEGTFVPELRRLLKKRPGDVTLDLALTTGRPYVPPPPTLDISTNDLCGLRCVMCKNRNTRRDPATMAATDIGQLLRDAAAWGIRRVALTGSGEPFRDPELPHHLELADSLGQLTTVTSNGLPINDALAARLVRSHVSVSLSIHGATDETHDAITGIKGSARAAWKAIRRLVAAREAAGTQSRFFISVSTVIQRANVSEIAALVARSREAGCDGHNLQPINLQHGRFVGTTDSIERRDDEALMRSLWPLPEQAAALDALFDHLVALRRQDGYVRADEGRLELFRRYFRDSSREALGTTCRVGETFLGIDHRGRVKPCYRLPWSLADARVLRVQRLWNSRRYGAVRRSIEACPLTCLNNCFFRKR